MLLVDTQKHRQTMYVHTSSPTGSRGEHVQHSHKTALGCQDEGPLVKIVIPIPGFQIPCLCLLALDRQALRSAVPGGEVYRPPSVGTLNIHTLQTSHRAQKSV